MNRLTFLVILYFFVDVGFGRNELHRDTRILKDMRLAGFFIFSGDYSLTTAPITGDYKTSTDQHFYGAVPGEWQESPRRISQTATLFDRLMGYFWAVTKRKFLTYEDKKDLGQFRCAGFSANH